MDRVSIERMCAGREFQVEGADTENTREEKLFSSMILGPKDSDSQVISSYIYIVMSPRVLCMGPEALCFRVVRASVRVRAAGGIIQPASVILICSGLIQ